MTALRPLWIGRILRLLTVPICAVVLPIGFLVKADSFLKLESAGQLGGQFVVACAVSAVMCLAIAVLAGALVWLLARLGLNADRVRDTAQTVTAVAALVAVVVAFAYGANTLLQGGERALSRAASPWSFWLLIAGAALMPMALMHRRSAAWVREGASFVARSFATPALAFVAAALLVLCWYLLTRESPMAAPAAVAATPATRTESRPDVILITMDALTAEDMSLYGYARRTTPRLEEYARSMDVYERFYANANFTTSGVASLMSGQRPWTHRVIHLEGALDAKQVPNNLPALFRRNGYVTAAFTANPFAHPAHQGIANGYDYLPGDYLGFIRNQAFAALTVSQEFKLQLIADTFPFYHVLDRLDRMRLRWDPNWQPQAPEPLLEDAFQFASAHHRQDRPFFLWVHLFVPHHYYMPPAPFLRSFDPSTSMDAYAEQRRSEGRFADSDTPVVNSLRARYDENILYADALVGGFLDRLRSAGMYEDSLIAITADHGESFDHGYLMHDGAYLYEPLVHIPLLVHQPQQRADSRSALLGEQADLLPTLADFAGLPIPPEVEGRSLRSAAPDAEHAVFAMALQANWHHRKLTTGTVAMITARYKYLHYLSSGAVDELFDLEKDPIESHNEVSVRPEVAASMRKSIRSKLHDVDRWPR